MLIVYALREAYQSLTMHKSRTLSMGFGVGWTLFMLILLLGAGNGLHRGITNRLRSFGEKPMFIMPGYTVKGSHEIPVEIIPPFLKQFNFIQHGAAVFWWKGKDKLSFNGKEVTINDILILGVDCFYPLVATTLSMKEGRFFTLQDEREATNSCIIGNKCREDLFGKEVALGQYILLDDVALQVVGVLDNKGQDFLLNSNCLVINSSFLKNYFPLKYNGDVGFIRLTLAPAVEMEWAERRFRSYFARQLDFDVKEERAINIHHIDVLANNVHKFFKNVSAFIWIIAICLLVTGIVGISNMMLVTIHERIQEIAIRRVLGASSIDIIAMIAWEVALVTCLATVLGMGAGFLCMQLLNKWVVPLLQAYYVSALTCTPAFALQTGGVIFCTSCLGSIVPVARALQIKPVEALGSK